MTLTKTNKDGIWESEGSVTEASEHTGVDVQPYRVLYIINALTRGGAELGLKTLVERRLFSNVELELLLIHEGDDRLYQDLRSHPDIKNIYIADKHKSLRVSGMIKTLWFLLRYCAAGKCQMIIASLAQPNIITLLVAQLFPSIKVASFFHNTSYSKSIYEKIIKALSGRIDYGFYDHIKTFEAVENKIPQKAGRQWFYLPLFISQEAVSKNRYEAATPLRIFSVGRLNAQKNYLEALQAIRQLVDDGCDVKYLIAGEGELHDALLACRSELKLERHVELLGFCEDWQNLVQEMDVYLLASTREGMSIATLEAMSYGLPVVATNVGGVQEYGKHMHNMIVVEQPNAPAIAAGIKQLMESVELREQLGRNAQATSAELFGQQAVDAQYHTVKQSVFRARV